MIDAFRLFSVGAWWLEREEKILGGGGAAFGTANIQWTVRICICSLILIARYSASDIFCHLDGATLRKGIAHNGRCNAFMAKMG